MRKTAMWFKIIYFLSSQFLVYFFLLLLILVAKMDEKIVKNFTWSAFSDISITYWKKLLDISKISTLILVSRILCFILVLSAICIILLCVIFHNLVKNNPKEVIQPKNKKDNRNYVFISSQYNKGFRDFVLSTILPLMTSFSITDKPLTGLCLLICVELLMFLFYVTSSDFLPNITLSILGFRIFEGKQNNIDIYCFGKVNRKLNEDNFINNYVEVIFLTGKRNVDRGYPEDNVCVIKK